MKLRPLLCGRKTRRTQIVPRNIFRGFGFVVQHVRPAGDNQLQHTLIHVTDSCT